MPSFSSFRGRREGGLGLWDGGAALCAPRCPPALGDEVSCPLLAPNHINLRLLLQLSPLRPRHRERALALAPLMLLIFGQKQVEKPIASLIRARSEFYRGYGVGTDPIRLLGGTRTVPSNVEVELRCNESKAAQSGPHHRLHERYANTARLPRFLWLFNWNDSVRCYVHLKTLSDLLQELKSEDTETLTLIKGILERTAVP